jgi:hypothetical protein
MARTVPCATSAAVAMSRLGQSDPVAAVDLVLIFGVGFAPGAARPSRCV